jgi:hypothetical protein
MNGDMKMWKYGNVEIWKCGNMEICKCENCALTNKDFNGNYFKCCTGIGTSIALLLRRTLVL